MMPQSTKCNAEIAFEGKERNSPHKPKKARTKRKRPNEQTTALLPSKEQPLADSQVSENAPENEVGQKTAEEPSARIRVRERAGGKNKRTEPLQASSDISGNASPIGPITSQVIEQRAPIVSTPKRNKKNQKNKKERTSSETKALKIPDGLPASKSSSPITIPSKGQSNSATSKSKKDASVAEESVQQKFVQAAQKDGLAVFSVPIESDQLALVGTNKKRKQKQKTSSATPEVKGTGTGLNINRWSFSPSKGGIFIDQDPLLTDDGQHLILPVHSQVRVYSTKTSLLVRSSPVSRTTSIVSSALSTVDPTKIYIAYTNDTLSLWDWTTNEKAAQTDTQKRIRRIVPLTLQTEEEIVLVLRHGEDKSSSVVAYAVDHTKQEFKLETTILHRPFSIANLESYAHGSVLIASSYSKLLIGYSQDVGGEGAQIPYTWRELSIAGSVTAFDAQVRSNKSNTGRKVPIVDLVVGLNSGIIMLYQDLLYKLIGKEKKSNSEDIIPRKLHWHRTAVNTVKWSRDRQYIISGGNETVLVVWQLDTNQKQFLPHLSTSILNLTVSAKGSEYALRLGDNSVMILSTADLLPSTNITGPAFREDVSLATPMLLHPTIANRLLAAVPANAITKNQQRENSAALLQQFDIESDLQISRQALTRNVTTAKNVAPTGQPVSEPSVDYIAISHDGRWLATVDEWRPLTTDIESMYLDVDSPESRGVTTETCLRIWAWNVDDNTWELVTRINEPHRPGDRSVLGLVASHSKAEFVTIGSDSTIRIWSPKARHRNGVAVRNKSNEQLYTWSSSRSIECGHDLVHKNDQASAAALAYSDDGSTIAASWSWSMSQTRVVHLVDSVSGKISLSLPDLLSTGDAHLAFAGRHLLCLSDTFCVFDTLTTQNVFTINLDPEAHGQRHLATNKYDGTVAISIAHTEKNKPSKLLVMNITAQEVKPVFETSMSGFIQSLLASTTGTGYIVIDGKARISTLRASGVQKQTLSSSKPAEPAQVSKSLDSIFGRASRPFLAEGNQEELQIDEANALSSSSLDAALRFVSSSQAPSPAELFERVVGAFSRRDTQKPLAT
jgi:NET1-associated nuclear protein 1 (U3 small nucleolar RNA-associated protein 17)